MSQDKHPLVLVTIDGVYSQDGDLAPLKEIIALCKSYGVKPMMDDEQGTGVIGKTGSGLIETCHAWDDIDLISDTFSKTFGHVGGPDGSGGALLKFTGNSISLTELAYGLW